VNRGGALNGVVRKETHGGTGLYTTTSRRIMNILRNDLSEGRRQLLPREDMSLTPAEVAMMTIEEDEGRSQKSNVKDPRSAEEDHHLHQVIPTTTRRSYVQAVDVRSNHESTTVQPPLKPSGHILNVVLAITVGNPPTS